MARAKNKIELLIEAKVKDAIRDLDKTEKELDQLSKQGKKSSAVFKKLGMAAAGFMSVLAIKQIAGYAVELAKIGDSALQAEGPFKKLVNQAGKQMPEALNDLRKAVRGTASDMELMQRAGAAMDAFTASGMSAGEAFKATQETMDFLYRYATKFGKNFNDLMQTVFTGLQRGSALFLDDVGIMINQTDEQFKGLTEVEKKAQIVRVALEQMAEKNELLGDVTEAANVKTRQAAAEFENFKAAIGKILNEPVGEFFAGLTSVLKGFTASTKSAAETYIGLRDATTKSETEIKDLTQRYTELKKIIKPSVTEQEELNKVIARLAELVPGSISAVNQYGDALDINLGAVNRFLDGQRRLLRRTKEDAFEGVKKNISKELASFDTYSDRLNKALVDRKKFEKAASEGKSEIVTNITMEMDGGDLVMQTVANVQDNLKSLDEVINENQTSITGMQDELNGLVSELAIFYNLGKTTPDKLSAELKVSNEQAQLLIERFNELNKAEEADGGKGGKKPKKVKTTDADVKRRESLELQLQLNKIELDDTKNKYQKMRDAVKVRYAAEIEAAKDKTEIITALRKLETDEITKIDNQETEERIKKEKEQTQKIKDIRLNISLMGAKDEFAARLLEIEAFYDKELELAAGNAELIALLEAEKTGKIKQNYDELAQHIAANYWEQHEAQASFKDAAEAGYDTFVNNITNTEMTGAEKRKAIWQNMQQSFISTLATSLKKYITNKMTELLIDTTVEKTKTSVKQSGVVQRVAADKVEIASSAANATANTTEAASGFFSAYSSIPYVGYALAAAAILGMLAMLASIGGKKKGGIITAGDLFKGIIPDGEDGIIGVQEEEFVVNKQATRKNRKELEAMNRGEEIPAGNEGTENAGKLYEGDGLRPSRTRPVRTMEMPNSLKLPAGYSLSEIPAPQPVVVQREFHSYREVIERSIPIEGKIVVETIAPDFAREKEHYIKINREVNMPDADYVNTMLKTQKGEYDT